MNTDMRFDFSNQYLYWLKQNIYQYQIDDKTFRITMPFLDKNNDQIEIYIIKHDDIFTITDDGSTLNDLMLAGYEIKKGSSREKYLNSIIVTYGIERTTDNELIIKSSMKDLPMKKHLFAQCIMRIGDMFSIDNSDKSIFIEDVKGFLDKNKIRYVTNVSIKGKSHFYANYDFVIAHSEVADDRFISVINNMNTNAARRIIFSWNDTCDERDDSRLYAFIRDNNKASGNAINAIKEYGIIPALWSERDAYINDLSA